MVYTLRLIRLIESLAAAFMDTFVSHVDDLTFWDLCDRPQSIAQPGHGMDARDVVARKLQCETARHGQPKSVELCWRCDAVGEPHMRLFAFTARLRDPSRLK